MGLSTVLPSEANSGFAFGTIRRVVAATSGGLSVSVFKVDRDGSATFIAGRVSHVSARHQARWLFGREQKEVAGR